MTPASKLSILTFAALVAASLSSAAFAERGMPGPMRNFDEIDADKDGTLTKEEISAFWTSAAVAADTDKDGNLSPEEMVAMREKGDAAQKLARASKMIARLDADSNGLLSTAEMAAGPGGDKMFKRVDADGDGALSRAEVDAMPQHKGKHGAKGCNHDMPDEG